jgi:hypothetical protein
MKQGINSANEIIFLKNNVSDAHFYVILINIQAKFKKQLNHHSKVTTFNLNSQQ